MEHTRRNVFLLACCQALLFTNNVTLISIQGLTGYALAANKALATLPVTMYIIGAALTTIPASLYMKRVGRRNGFLGGTAVGIVGALIATAAMALSSFWLLCFGSLVLGVYNAFGQYYRFAAADSAKPDFKAKAISYVLAGGLVGGIVGPELSKITRTWGDTDFLWSYASLIAFCALAMIIISQLKIPDAQVAADSKAPRPLKAIMAQPVFVVAVMSSAIGYGVMNFLMTATPLAMGFCGHPYGAAATVISWHVIAMFAPSFVTGDLIKRFGAATIALIGVLIMFATTAIALSGLTVAHFWFSLVLLGLGWNFMYIGGTSLLTEVYSPAERAKTQGMHDFLVFCTTSTSSLVSGVLVKAEGWNTLNVIAIPFLVLSGIALAWLMAKRGLRVKAA